MQTTGAVRWKYETGLGIASSPAASGDLAVVGSKDGYLYAFDIPTGQLRWKTQVGQVATAPPVFGDGFVCIQSGGTLALDAGSGRVLWRAGLGGSVQSVPVLTRDMIYLTSGDGEVYALE
ncbi:MAG TPA: PQQ-binding-like beta-propeller repeat protein [Terriglobales bacterium]|nr:PQQ-binding-like beta-propeller repeat protein [Terriglobales bacterium]